MRTTVLLLLALMLIPAPRLASQADGAQPLNPLTIAQALAAAKPQRPDPYVFRSARLWVDFDTPLLRLQRKLADTAAQRQPIEDSLATPDVTEPVLRVTVGPEPSGGSAPEVLQIFVEQAGGVRVAPRSVEKTVEKAASRQGKVTLKGLKAVFPLEALQPGGRFRAMLSGKREEVLPVPPGWFDLPR